ncbi:MAG: excinuclease ABC subunit UvrC [Desulfobaccales bacterium]
MEKPSPYPVLTALLPQVPRKPGVYLFKDAGGRVLYVGKAANLRHRLGSYLKAPEQHDPKTALMLKKIREVQYLLTATEREALILERNLIKEHRPRYNIELRDDKNFLCLRLDLKEDFPALRFVRRFAPDGALYFGPYAHAAQARETVRLMKQVFGIRTCKGSRLVPRSRPCLNAQVGRCLGPCAGLVSREDYRRAVLQAVQFLKGRGRSLLAGLKREMAAAAQALEFEKAARLRDRIEAVRQTLERQGMARPHFKDQDVLGVAREGSRGLILVLLVRQGLVVGSQEYYFPDLLPDLDLLGDFLKQYYREGRPLPDEILLPQDIPDRRLLAQVLSEQRGRPVRLLAVPGFTTPGPSPALSPAPAPVGPASVTAADDYRRLVALAQENAQAALERRLRVPLPPDALADLQQRLGLPAPPRKLACLDISTLQGAQPVGALVTFTDGAPDKKGYRRFRIREVAGQDDYAMLAEVVRRHFGKEEADLPDLLVVDGGKGQLQAVMAALAEVDRRDLPVVALAKEGTAADGRPVRDRLFLPGRKNPKFLPADSPGWLLLLRLRDEAHRFAVTHHRRRARRELLDSHLTQIPGIGPARRRVLLSRFASLAELQAAGVAELAALPGFTRPVAERLHAWLQGKRTLGEEIGERGDLLTP